MKSKTHEVTIRVRFDAPLTRRQARYAVWNAIDGLELYGDGKRGAFNDHYPVSENEPYDYGKIAVPRR